MTTNFLRQLLAGLRLLLVLTLVLGVAYPLVVGVGARALGDRAAGQPVTSHGRVVGSALIGQDVTGPQWFHSRPSAGGYDTLASGPTNLGPSDPDLVRSIEQRRASVATAEGVPAASVPADAVTASGSGLDPHISPAYAQLQVPRVARERRLPVQQVRALVEVHTSGRALGFLGDPTVDVLALNLALRDVAGGAD